MTTLTIHTPLQMGPHRLSNRLVALPVFTGYANPDGSVSPLLLKHYSTLAASGVSMVVVANVAVSRDGVTSRYNLRIDEDGYIPGLRELAAAIKRQGALACIQLNHAGRFAKTDQPLLASPVDASNLAYHVSSLKGFMNSFPFEKRFGLTRFFLKQIAAWRRAITKEEMDAVVEKFSAAAERAHLAGFEMIELHGANGYLLCEFFSPATNKRRSDFGGSFENRAAFSLTIVREIKRHVPPRVPLGFRLLLNEWVPEGIQLADAIAFAQLLDQAGISYLSAAAGTFNSIFSTAAMKKMRRLAYLREEMIQLTGQVTIPTIISGRITTPALANDLLKEKAAHLIGLGRPLRVDTGWVQKARHPTSPIKPCINCNWCLKRVILEQGFVCQCWPKTVQLKTNLDRMLLTRNYKCVWVIAEKDDLVLFKGSIPHLLPAGQWLQANRVITVLFLDSHAGPRCSAKEKTEFLTWVQQQSVHGGYRAATLTAVDKTVQDNRNKAVAAEVKNRNCGMVLIGRNRRQPWRVRLLYTLRHTVIGLISPNRRLCNVAVLLDFSDASLLALGFVRHAFVNRPGVRLRFIHALDGTMPRAKRRWSQFKRVADLDPEEPLTLIPSKGNVTAAILEQLAVGQYGTIIMGKRGLSGIKRLLLGSVSRAVLRRIDTQSLFLVD